MRAVFSKSLWVALALCTLAGCGSTPPNNFHLLSAPEVENQRGQSPAIGVGPIDIPEYIDRNTLVFLDSANELRLAQYQRWAEPLADGIERVVKLNLGATLNTQNVQSFPWHRKQQPDYGVRINLLSLDAQENQAKLVAEWIIQKPGTGEFLQRNVSTVTQPMHSDSAAAIAPAYSALLKQLSGLIAAAISTDMEQTDSAD